MRVIMSCVTGHGPAPTRPVSPGEGLVIGGHEVPEQVIQPRLAPPDREPEPEPA